MFSGQIHGAQPVLPVHRSPSHASEAEHPHRLGLYAGDPTTSPQTTRLCHSDYCGCAKMGARAISSSPNHPTNLQPVPTSGKVKAGAWALKTHHVVLEDSLDHGGEHLDDHHGPGPLSAVL